MNQLQQENVISILLIVLGAALFFFVAADLMWRIALALFALMLINNGLRMRHLPSLQTLVQMWFNQLHF
jgi:hypothetical protein